MTNYELEKMAKLTAKYLIEELKRDDSLIDSLLPPKFMNIQEASIFTGLPIGTIYQKINQIPHTKCGKRLIFSDRALARWMNRQ
jgi:hypothetical protein